MIVAARVLVLTNDFIWNGLKAVDWFSRFFIHSLITALAAKAIATIAPKIVFAVFRIIFSGAVRAVTGLACKPRSVTLPPTDFFQGRYLPIHIGMAVAEGWRIPQEAEPSRAMTSDVIETSTLVIESP